MWGCSRIKAVIMMTVRGATSDMHMTRKLLIVIATSALLASCASPAGDNSHTADNPPAGDAGQAASEPAACRIVGRWRGRIPAGILANEMMVLEFFEDGRARGQAGWVTLITTWERTVNIIAITGVSAEPAMAGCPPEEVGHYTLSFEPSCDAVQTIQAEDPCRHRRMTLENVRATRMR